MATKPPAGPPGRPLGEPSETKAKGVPLFNVKPPLLTYIVSKRGRDSKGEGPLAEVLRRRSFLSQGRRDRIPTKRLGLR